MNADWSVELGHDDPALEFPWSSEDGAQRFVDLSQNISSIEEIAEAQKYPELAEFLREVNVTSSPWITAKCDLWIDRELGEAEQIYGAQMKMGSYVDLIRRNQAERFSFALHEHFVKQTTLTLQQTADAAMACELIVRRCWYHTEGVPQREPAPGFYISVYIFGYGDDEVQTRNAFGQALTSTVYAIAASEG